jgi:SAM-dependent methyltransferase
MTEQKYVYDAAWEGERARLAAIEALWDTGSRALLSELGVGPHARVLEVGAGGGALVEWMAGQVGPQGRVLATDIDTRFLTPLEGGPVAVTQHDITSGPPPEDGFDIAHARLLVEHLPDPRAVIANIAAAVRPGGWVVIEDYDWTGFGADPPDPLTDRVGRGVLGFMASAGFNPAYGRRVASDVAAAGLVDVTAEGRLRVIGDDHPGFAFFTLSLAQLKEPAVKMGALSAEDADAFIARVEQGGLRVITPAVVAASGRKP